MTDNRPHIPVMLNEVLEALKPEDGKTYVDGTFGAGGYTKAILDAADCTVIAIDRDPNAFKTATEMAKQYDGRLIPVHGPFSELETLLKSIDIDSIDGLVLDLGVSSMQIDQAERGFSFQKDGPLDMRMSQNGLSAEDVVNTETEQSLADMIYHFGQERKSRQIAKRIVIEREKAPITTTGQLADIIRHVKKPNPKSKTDPATKTFQALRIFVNDELGELDKVLLAAEHMLCPEGRLVVVTFHSLEDGHVKRFLRDHSGMTQNPSRHMPDLPSADEAPYVKKPAFLLESRKAINPSPEEIDQNPRARSARLRYGVRTSCAAPTAEGVQS